MNATIQRHLKRLALAERRDELRLLLQDYATANPQDIEAQEELRRLNNGEPLRLMLPAAERKKAMVNDARKAIEWLIDDHPIDELRLCNNETLRLILTKLQQHEKIILNAGQQMPEKVILYKKTLKKRTRELSGRVIRKHIGKIIITASACAIVGGTWYAMNNRAHEHLHDLKEALATPSYLKLLEAKKQANSKINLYFCPELSFLILEAEQWIAQQEKTYRDIDTLLTELENRRKLIIDLGPSELLNIENQISQSRINQEQLRSRWQDLCRQSYSEMRANQAQIRNRLEHPLPPEPLLNSTLPQYLQSLEEYLQTLKTRLAETQSTLRLYNIQSDIVTTLTGKIEWATRTILETKQLQSRLTQLNSCAGYNSFCSVIHSIPTTQYSESKNLMAIKGKLLTLQQVTTQISANKAGCTPALFSATKAAILDGAPTFPTEFPPNTTILTIPEDLFTAPSYHYKVYALKISETESWYSTIKPELHQSNFITFRRSSIDPNFSPEHNLMEFQNDDTYKLTEIDATQLVKDLNIERNTFFISHNIPGLLTQVLNYPTGKHPALAQAYVYLSLLQLLDAHPHPILTGIRFSPTLKKHAESFTALIKQHKITLRPGCWLSAEPAVQRAERAFDEWFKTHKGHDYAAEMKQNFLNDYSATAVYCGFINEEGEPVFIRQAKDAAQLYYISDEGLTTERTKALPLSPIFTME